MTTMMYRSTLWSDDISTFNDIERRIWENANEKIYDGHSEYFVVVKHQRNLPALPEQFVLPDPTPKIPRQSFLGALVRLIVWTVGVIALQLVLVLAFFALIFVLHLIGVLPPL